MNTTVTSLSSEHSWDKPGKSRRSSVESVLSIQSKETEFVRDTSDTEWPSDEDDIEFEPITDPEDDTTEANAGDSSSDNDIIATKVVEVSVGDEGDLEFADSEQEQTRDGDSDSEIDLHDYWKCVKCHATNNNPLYRYCEQCFKVRKNLFPPRPKRKGKRATTNLNASPLSNSQRVVEYTDSGVDSVANSQELSQDILTPPHSASANRDGSGPSQIRDTETSIRVTANVILNRKSSLKRRAESADRGEKRAKTDYSDSDSSSDSDAAKPFEADDVKPLVKAISDPSLTIDDPLRLTKKAIANSFKEKFDDKDNLCIVCFTEPKSGVFVHGRIAHICCCYKCAIKVWTKLKRCPVCNRKVSNVLKAVIM